MSFKQDTEYGVICSEFTSSLLSELCESKNGIQTGPFGSQLHNKDYVEKGTPIITVEHLNDNRITMQNMPFVSDDDKDRLSKYCMKTDDIIFSRVGSVDRRALVRKREDGWLFSGRCLRVRPLQEKIDSAYLSYFFGLETFKEHIRRIAVGATMPSINTKILSNVKIYYPGLAEQKAIARVLTSLDEKIEVNNQINKTLENMAQAIFKQWFVDFEFPNEDGEPYKSSGGEMVESELGMIPKGWEVGNLAESKLTNLVKTGIAEFSGEKIYLATADVENSNILSKSTKVTHNERPSRANMTPRENTVWFAKMKDSRKLIRVSKKSKELIDNYIFSTGFAGINVKEGLNYIWSFICSEDFDTRKNNLCNGTTMQAINNSNISNIPLLLPNEEILKKYEDITDYLFESEYLRKKENEKLAEIRDALLPKLMSGEIRVPLDEEGDAS